jgi:SpoVK/Ycf46/Vps4 family AAA+-type ATPase
MVIDDCEGIFARRGLNRASVAEELMMIFLAEWESTRSTDPGVRVIGATSRRELLDDEVLRRFQTIIEIGLPDEPQRQRMFQLMLGEENLDFDCQAVAGELAALTPGAAGRHIKKIVDDAWMHVAARDHFLNLPLLTRADLLACVPARLAN